MKNRSFNINFYYLRYGILFVDYTNTVLVYQILPENILRTYFSAILLTIC